MSDSDGIERKLQLDILRYEARHKMKLVYHVGSGQSFWSKRCHKCHAFMWHTDDNPYCTQDSCYEEACDFYRRVVADGLQVSYEEGNFNHYTLKESTI